MPIVDGAGDVLSSTALKEQTISVPVPKLNKDGSVSIPLREGTVLIVTDNGQPFSEVVKQFENDRDADLLQALSDEVAASGMTIFELAADAQKVEALAKVQISYATTREVLK